MKNLLAAVCALLLSSVITAQRVGINTTDPKALLHVKDSNVVFTGGGIPIGDDPNPPISGIGHRMMWYPARVAFRVGGVTDKNWNKDSVGFFSFAAGDNPRAKGDASIAMGKDVKATGLNAVALGFNTTASGAASFAAGRSGLASGDFSTAMGWSSTASGSYSIAMGNNSLASGINSTAIGKDIRSIGLNSLGLGYNTTASGDYSTALGNSTNANGDHSFAAGFSTVATGIASTAFGIYTSAGGTNSTALGLATTANGEASTAMGFTTQATGGYSTAMGNYSQANGGVSTAMGNNTRANGEISTAMGTGTIASGKYSTVTGLANESAGYSSFVAGMYNDPVIGTQTSVSAATPLFIIGSGDDDAHRSNALLVRKNGNVGIGSNIPFVKLHIDGGSDASLSSTSGFMVLGNVTASNMVIDNNEIIARNNGAGSILYLQSPGGNVAIGVDPSTDPAVSHTLDVNGTAGKPGGGSWVTYSDARLKHNIHPYTDGLSSLMKINPVLFQYNSLSGHDTKPTYVGVIAQELQKISPYMVSSSEKKVKDGSPAYLQVDNSAMTYMLINAVKEQQKQIEELKKDNEQLTLLVKQLLKK